MNHYSKSNTIPFLVFVHVEKAGGITVNNMLHHYLWSYISPRPRYGEQFTKNNLRIIQRFYPLKISGIGGHRISPTERYSPNQFRFSIIREPIKRVISHLNWQINKMGIDHAPEDFVNNVYFQNFQTFRLTRCRNFKEAKKILLDHYDFIGILEDFDSSIRLLSKLYIGDDSYFAYEKKNTTTQNNESYSFERLPEKIQKSLVKKNQIDIDVYNWVFEEIYTPLKEKQSIENKNNSHLSTPISTRFKRKSSNFYVGRILQPFFQEEVKFGY